MEYLKPSSLTGTSFNVGNYNFQDTKMSIKSAEVAYAKIEDHNLDNTTLTAATAANTSALSTLDSAYTTSSSDTSIDVTTLKGKTAYMTPGTDITTISDTVTLTGLLNTNTCDVGKASNFIVGKTVGNLATISGTSNTVIGNNCGIGLTSCTGNVICGFDSGKEITTGSNNTIVGYSSTNSATNTPTATNATSVGYGTSTLLNNGTAIGTLAHGAGDGLITIANDKIYLGNSDIDTFYCNVTSITSLSDERDKLEITDLNTHFDSMEYINNLNPKLYKLNPRVRYKNNDTNIIEVNDGSKADTNYSIGLIAQEVKTYEDTLNLANPLIYNEMNDETLALSYSKLIPVLVSALKQSNTIINDLTLRIETLENTV